jgi:hypothetical protein
MCNHSNVQISPCKRCLKHLLLGKNRAGYVVVARESLTSPCHRVVVVVECLQQSYQMQRCATNSTNMEDLM